MGGGRGGSFGGAADDFALRALVINWDGCVVVKEGVMKVMHVVLGVLVAGGVGVAAWQVMGRGKEEAEPPRVVNAAGDARAALARELNRAVQGAIEKPVLTIRGEAGKGVTTAAFSPEGKLLAVGDGAGEVRVVEVATGKELRRTRVVEGAVKCLSWSGDGKRLAAGGAGKTLTGDKVIAVWDAGSGELLERYTQPCVPAAVVFLADGKRVVSVCGEHLRWWKAGDEAPTVEEVTGEPLMAIASTGADEVVAADSKGVVAVMNEEGEVARVVRPRWREDTETDAENVASDVRAMGKGVLITDRSGVWMWERDGEKGSGKAALVRFARSCFFGAMTGDGKVVVGAGPRGFFAYDVEKKRDLGARPGGFGRVQQLAMSPAGNAAALVGGGKWGQYGEWSAEGGTGVEVVSLESIEGAMGRDTGGILSPQPMDVVPAGWKVGAAWK